MSFGLHRDGWRALARFPAASLAPVLILLPLAAQAASTALPKGAPAALAKIDRHDLIAHVSYLASDELQGRLTGSPGQGLAAEYVSRKLQEFGLEPYGDRDENGVRGWLQKYPIRRTFLDPQKTSLAAGGKPLPASFAVLPGQQREPIVAEGDLVFLGLGRTGGEHPDVSDSTRLDGKIAFVLLRSQAKKPPSVEAQFFMAMQPLTSAARIAGQLEGKGARLVVFGILEAEPDTLVNMVSHVAISPGHDLLETRADLAKIAGEGSMLGQLARPLSGTAPRVFAMPKLTAALLDAVGVKPAAAKRLLTEKSAPAPKSKAVAARIELGITVDDGAFATNVVGLRRGRDPALAKQAVVFSAHMDHVGTRADGEVFNGADDDASGTSGLLEVAQAFGQEPAPRRSLLFVSVSGEELGLWGSAWFADRPTFEGELVADVNIDMIGRSGEDDGYHKDATSKDSVMITPSPAHEMFSTIVQDAARMARTLKLELESGDVYYHRSDHYNFAKKGIPVVFFCTGEHTDYHQVSDEVQKLDGAKMERVARLAAWTGWLVAEADERPKVLGSGEGWEGGETPAKKKK